jgi:hypothetical protein
VGPGLHCDGSCYGNGKFVAAAGAAHRVSPLVYNIWAQPHVNKHIRHGECGQYSSVPMPSLWCEPFPCHNIEISSLSLSLPPPLTQKNNFCTLSTYCLLA